MPDFMQDIKDFHERFMLTYEGKPRQLPEDLQSFRNLFLEEELTEYQGAVRQIEYLRSWQKAIKTEDAGHTLNNQTIRAFEQALDGLVDLVYVALGTAYLHGFDFNEAWRRVHTANMLKVRAENSAVSKRGSTHDVVKPPGWNAPDHYDLVKDAVLREDI